MKTLMNLPIPALYRAYARMTYSGRCGTYKNGRPANESGVDDRYYCLSCGANFKVEHRPVPMTYGYDDTDVICLVCGRLHSRRPPVSDIAILDPSDNGDAAPVSLYLSLTEARDAVTLRVWSMALQMDRDRETRIYPQTELFRFDIRHRQTTYTLRCTHNRSRERQVELGGLDDMGILSHSMLCHVRSGNLAFSQGRYSDNPEMLFLGKQRRKNVYILLKKLRDAVQRKWKQFYGYPLSSTFVSYGSRWGMLVFPILNIAWRIQYPDAPNLPKQLNEHPYTAEYYFKSRMFTKDLIQTYRENGGSRTMSSAQTVIRALGLPDYPFVRRILTRDLLAGPELQQVFRITRTPDYARRLLLALGWADGPHGLEITNHRARKEDYDLIRTTLQAWPVRAILTVLEKPGGLQQLADTWRMWNRIGEEGRREGRVIPLGRLHDWLVDRIQEIREAGFSLSIPDAVRRRLQMQLDNGYLRFFVPGHSHELDHASGVFHNCVRTYSEDVRDGKCYIVLMTDHTGLMQACLEVRDGGLVQARLKYNKPVSCDGAVNGAVRDWCREAGLYIRTPDVRQVRYPVPIERRAV